MVMGSQSRVWSGPNFGSAGGNPTSAQVHVMRCTRLGHISTELRLHEAHDL